MKLDAEVKRVVQLERRAAEYLRLIAAQGAARTDLDATELKTLTEAFPDPKKADAFLSQIPKKPGAKAILAAFDKPADLVTLVDTTLAGDMRALAVFAEVGCKGNAATLKGFADRFAGHADFAVVFKDSGMASRPEALAALFDGGCDSNLDKFEKLITTFKKPTDAAMLGKSLAEGGLAQAPAALGALAAGDDGVMLKALAGAMDSDEKRARLNGLLQEGGLDGRAPGRADLLRDVIKNGLGNDPARLVELHDAFHTAPGVNPVVSEMDTLGRLLTGLDSGSDQNAGLRLHSVLDGFVTRDTLSTAEAAKRLKDPFMKSLESRGRGAASPEVSSGTAERTAKAVVSGPLPVPEMVTGLLASTLGPGQPEALRGTEIGFILGAEMAGLLDSATAMGATAASLDSVDPGLDPDDTYTAETSKLTTELGDAIKVVAAAEDGGGADLLRALDTKAAALVQRAASEPDEPVRKAALAEAAKAATAIAQAISRAATVELAATGAAGAAVAGLADLTVRRKGVASAEELEALEKLSMAARQAAIAAAGAENLPKDTAAAALIQINAMQENQREQEKLDRKAHAETATALATAATKELKACAAPIDPALVARVSALAARAVEAGRATSDQTAATNAFDAAKAAAETVAEAAKRSAAGAEVAAALTSPEATKSLIAGANMDQAFAALTNAGLNARATNASDIATAARAGGIALAETERLIIASDGLTGAAEAIARRSIADPSEYNLKIAANNKAAEDAGDAARVAKEALAAAAATDPDYDSKLARTVEKAQEALRLAPLAADPVIRKAALQEAEAALKLVGPAASELANEMLKTATSDLKTEQQTASLSATAERRALIADYDPGPGAMSSAALAGDVDKTRVAMNNTAAALLSSKMLDTAHATPETTTAITARDAAIVSEAKAAVPGADPLSKISALEARRDANKALCDVAFQMADDYIAKLPPNPTGNAVTPLTTADGDGVMPDQAFRNAIAACEAATSSAAKWYESACSVLEGIRANCAEVETGSPEFGLIDGRKGAAELAKTAAATKQATVSFGSGSSIGDLKVKAKAWAKWVNQKGFAGRIDGGDIVGSYGLGLTQAREGTQQGFTPRSRDELIRNAATLKGTVYAPMGNTHDLENGAVEGPDDVSVRKKHIAGRHTRESYDFGNLDDGGPMPDDHAAAKLIAAAYEGMGNPPAGKLRDLKVLGNERDKVNSLLPEEVATADVIAVSQMALAAAIALPPPPPPATATIAELVAKVTALGNWWPVVVNINIPPQRDIKIGIKVAGGKPVADMMHGDSTNTMMMPDMLTMGRAIGK